MHGGAKGSGFFYAGARALLVSHWSADSNAATRLTTSTFDYLKADPTMRRTKALRRAMLAYLKDDADPRNAYAAYWAAGAPLVVSRNTLAAAGARRCSA